MKKISKIYNSNFLNIFLIVQPFIDILTSFMIKYLNTSITIGVVLRSLFLIYALIYLVFISKKHKKFKLVYSILFIMFFVGFIMVNCNNTYFLDELICFVKFIYYPIVLLFLIEVFETNETYETLYKTVIILNILMILSQFIGTVIPSYGYGKIGNSGWFFSANELGVIFSILFPIIFYKFIVKTKLFNLFILIITSICMLIIGTKTTYLAIFITLILYIIYLILEKIIFKTKIAKNMKKTILMFLIFMLLTPLMPIYTNMNYHLKYLNINSIFNESDNSLNISDKEDDELKNLIFYGREKYLSDIKKVSNESGLDNKLFGLGKVTKSDNLDYKYFELEMDFHNVIYCYGIFGFIIFLIPQLFVFSIIIKSIIKKGIRIIDDRVFLLGVSILLAYLVAYMAGHTLLTVSPATYLSYIIAIIYVIIVNGSKEKRKVMFISSVGGHLTQLLELKSLFKDYDYVLITEKTDVTSNMKDKYNMAFLPYGSRNQKMTYPFILLWNCIKSLIYIIKYNPDVIITTGANTAAATCCLGKIFGKKVIYIESFAKRTSPTITGKSIYKLHAYTIFVVQWESMLKYYPKAEYWGGIY